jgi:hypothetical protein
MKRAPFAHGDTVRSRTSDSFQGQIGTVILSNQDEPYTLVRFKNGVQWLSDYDRCC